MQKIDELLNFRDAAAALGVSTAAIRLWTRQRRIPFIRLGTRVMFRAHDLQQTIDDNFYPSLKKKEDEL